MFLDMVLQCNIIGCHCEGCKSHFIYDKLLVDKVFNCLLNIVKSGLVVSKNIFFAVSHCFVTQGLLAQQYLHIDLQSSLRNTK